jgi:hypothetical protein
VCVSTLQDMQFSHEKDAQRGGRGRGSSPAVKRVATVVVRRGTSGHAVPSRAIELAGLCSVYALLSRGPDVTAGRSRGGTGRWEGRRARGKGRREQVYLRQRVGVRERVESTGAGAWRARGQEEAELERVRRGEGQGLGDGD